MSKTSLPLLTLPTARLSLSMSAKNYFLITIPHLADSIEALKANTAGHQQGALVQSGVIRTCSYGLTVRAYAETGVDRGGGSTALTGCCLHGRQRGGARPGIVGDRPSGQHRANLGTVESGPVLGKQCGAYLHLRPTGPMEAS